MSDARQELKYEHSNREWKDFLRRCKETGRKVTSDTLAIFRRTHRK